MLSSLGAAAKAGTGAGAGNSPDLTAQGLRPSFPAPEPGRRASVLLVLAGAADM